MIDGWHAPTKQPPRVVQPGQSSAPSALDVSGGLFLGSQAQPRLRTGSEPRSRWNWHESRAVTGGLRRSSHRATGWSSEKVWLKQWVKRSSSAVAATTERSPPVTARDRAAHPISSTRKISPKRIRSLRRASVSASPLFRWPQLASFKNRWPLVSTQALSGPRIAQVTTSRSVRYPCEIGWRN